MSVSSRPAATLSASSANTEIDKQLNELMADTNLDGRQLSSNKTSSEPVGDEREAGGENVVVMVRCRPLLESEKSIQSAIQVEETNKSVQVDNERQFFFDQVFAPATSSEQVYMHSARRLVEFAFNGYNCTIFLYGQTGTGKTYTHSSLTLSAFEHLFSLIQTSNKQARFLIRASYYELYNEEIRDLLATEGKRRRGGGGDGGGRRTTTTSRRRSSGALRTPGRKFPPPLELRESKERGVYIKDLTCFLVSNLNELIKLKQLGDKRRATAATQMNQHSSRSHSIFSITIEATTNLLDQQQGGGEMLARQEQKTSRVQASSTHSAKAAESLRLGRLHLIDLAGSERQSKSGSSGLQLKEASQINLSLTCLSLVIRALTDKTNAAGHIPYRNSKLTRLLSSSLGGNSKTLLMACISPARSNLGETLNTLRFAARTKQIKNKAVINEDPKDALLRKYRRQLEQLREQLEQTKQQRQVVRVDGQSAPDDNRRQDQQQLMMMKQLELLKAKIMFGGENLLDKMELHERLLEASREELEERQRAEAKLREELANKANSLKSVVHSRGSLEGQRAYLDEKLTKAIGLYRQSKLDLRDLSSEHEQLKEQLLLTVRSTTKEIKYTDCILDDFIPREYLDLINAYAHFDDESDEWQIKYIALSGNNIAQTRRLNVITSDEPPPESAHSGEYTDRGGPSVESVGKTSKRRSRQTHSSDHRPEPYIKL